MIQGGKQFPIRELEGKTGGMKTEVKTKNKEQSGGSTGGST